MFVFAPRDPAIRVQYEVRVPVGTAVAFEELNGAPQVRDDENGVRSLTWIMEASPGLKWPIAAQPAAYEPAVVWSTWEDWSTLDSTWREAINEAALADSTITAALDERLVGSLDPLRDTVAFWNESVRTIHYPFRFWKLAPRPAIRTWKTGYGHALDRAVLLQAMLRYVVQRDGATCTKVMCTRNEAGYGEVARDLPRLTGFDGLRVEVCCGDHGSWSIDPDGGMILDGNEVGRWSTSPLGQRFNSRADQHLSLSLTPGDAEAWSGSGVLKIRTGHADAEALDSQVHRAVHSVLPDAEVSAIVRDSGVLHFNIDLAQWPTNADDQPTLTVGPLDGGLLDRLPADVHLYEETRQSPVRLPWHLIETVELRLQVDDREVRTPEPFSMQGATGSFSVDVEKRHGWLRVTRRLDLHTGVGSQQVELDDPQRHLHPAESWPELRRLLLEAREPEHGTIVLE